jgi:ribokinase
MSDLSETLGGKGANQAAAAAALGATVHFVGAIGRDERGRQAITDLKSRGIRLNGTTSVTGTTGLAIVGVDRAGANSIAIVPGANALVTSAQVESALSAIEDEHVVVVACLEIPLGAVITAAQVARVRGWTFVLNPAPAVRLPAALLGMVSILTPNESEAQLLGGVGALLDMGVGAVVVTLGERGSELHLPGAEVHREPAISAHVVDTTGAGDAFTAALAVALSAGDSLREALRIAAAVGGIATEGHGARGKLPTMAEARSRSGIAADAAAAV